MLKYDKFEHHFDIRKLVVKTQPRPDKVGPKTGPPELTMMMIVMTTVKASANIDFDISAPLCESEVSSSTTANHRLLISADSVKARRSQHKNARLEAMTQGHPIKRTKKKAQPDWAHSS